MTRRHHLRRRVFEILERPSRADKLSWALELALIALIIANVVAVALETVGEIHAEYRTQFHLFDLLSVSVFTAEYVLRLWACVEAEPDLTPLQARLRYARSPIALVDLAARETDAGVEEEFVTIIRKHRGDAP